MGAFIDSILANLLTAFVTSKIFLYWIGIFFVYTLIFWLIWVCFNILYQRLETRTGWRRTLVRALLYVGLPFAALVDVVFNWVFATVLFLEIPHETTLSMRMTRYISGRTPNKLGHVDYGFRVPVAVWISTHLVEPFQPGHIGLAKYGYPEPKPLIDKVMSWKWVKKVLP